MVGVVAWVGVDVCGVGWRRADLGQDHSMERYIMSCAFPPTLHNVGIVLDGKLFATSELNKFITASHFLAKIVVLLDESIVWYYLRAQVAVSFRRKAMV